MAEIPVDRVEGEPQPLPLPDPYPEYVTCPHCGEPEVEVWSYEDKTRCHACQEWVPHDRPGDRRPD